MLGRLIMENKIKTDARLDAALSFVRKGAVVADVGTDHGYIPIYLVSSGISEYAYASDVNAQPLEKAKANARKYGVEDRIAFRLSDGLGFVEKGETNEKYPISDAVICGMGGELIAKIIDESDYVRQTGVRLILQPMTRADKLREYLAENGFATVGEKLCEAAGKIYTVICAEYDGVARNTTEAEAAVGLCGADSDGRLAREYLDEILKKRKTKIAGLKSGGRSTKEEKRTYREIKRLFRKQRRKSR